MSEKVSGECIIFKGPKCGKGYGRLSVNSKGISAHRLAYALIAGRMPRTGMDVCHACDNPSCINPYHLFEGSRSDNMRDCVSKKRHAKTKQEKCVNGHLFDKENSRTYTRKNGAKHRVCKICQKAFKRKWKEKRWLAKAKGMGNE